MFGKKCVQCGKRSRAGFSYCPHCGIQKKNKEEMEREFGLLGREVAGDGMIKGLPFGFHTLFNGLVKEIDRQVQKIDKEMGEERGVKEGVSITITSQGGVPSIAVNRFGQEKETRKVKITEEMAKKLASLPRKEASTTVRRLSNKLVYEVDLPGVKNLNDVLISKLESSIEIKAIAPDVIYVKLIPSSLPLAGCSLKDEKLVVEFKS